MVQRVAIVGAGIIGLLSARVLLARGVEVVVVDAARPARSASWAGGGILSPLYPWRYGEAVSALADGAQAAHAGLAHALLVETGIDPQYNPCGLLMLAMQETAAARDWARRRGRAVTDCDAEAIALLQPGLDARHAGALYWPDIGNVRNPRLLQALIAALRTHPKGALQAPVDVLLDVRDGDVVLRVNDRPLKADAILLATGAWSGVLASRLGIVLPVRPVRGQMLQFAPAPGLLRRIVLHDGRYLIPRRDGRILAGSTLEETGFDARTTAAARDLLYASAIAMLPALARVPVESQWSGLRPAAPAGIPFIDRVPGTRLWVNAGHYRNGLVLAPAAAALGVALMLGDQPAIDPAPYALSASRGDGSG